MAPVERETEREREREGQPDQSGINYSVVLLPLIRWLSAPKLPKGHVIDDPVAATTGVAPVEANNPFHWVVLNVTL